MWFNFLLDDLPFWLFQKIAKKKKKKKKTHTHKHKHTLIHRICYLDETLETQLWMKLTTTHEGVSNGWCHSWVLDDIHNK
jgi:hypothetical protein